MALDVKVYDNGDHTCIVWLPSDHDSIPNCLGFTIRRLLNTKESYLHGFVGFAQGDLLDPAAPWKLPLQRYMWWDYGVRPGDAVQYSVVPVLGPDKDHLSLSADASPLTDRLTITGQATAHVSSYFNKGIVAAQWVSRALEKEPAGAKILDLIATKGDPLRDALSGLLRPQLLSLLAETKQNGGEIYAALYELNDPELIDGLTALGDSCHLILANGAFKPPETDENEAVRSALSGKIDLHDRIVGSGHFAHNKFVVFCDEDGKPQRVLTGSTNWTETGLCTQANNAILVEDPHVAEGFLAEWKLLEGAGNGYPPSLAASNSTPKTYALDGAKITQWFAPTSEGQDLAYARGLIDAAREGILFLFFNPGAFVAADKPAKWTLLQNILVRHHPDSPVYDPSLYVRGVVNQEIANLTTLPAAPEGSKQPTVLQDPSTPAPITLFTGTSTAVTLGHDVMVPKNIKQAFGNWAAELLGSGVHVHSKVIVLDPFGEHPVVMTGSHNLGYKASTENDDNLMIIEGNAPLAAAYALNIIGIYETYRWNAYVEAHRQDPKAWHGLIDSDAWQAGYLKGEELAETEFWLGGAQAGT